MPEQDQPKQELRPDVQEIKTRFVEALFGEPDENSVFGSFPPDIPIRVAESVREREEELRSLTDRFFTLVNEVTTARPGMIPVAAKYVDANTDESTTFSRAALELPREKRGDKHEQIYLSEHSPMNVSADEDPEAYSLRPDIQQANKRDLVITNFVRLSETNTEEAARVKKNVLGKIAYLSRKPIETINIQYQTVEGPRTYHPHLGLRLVKYLDGWQAYPVIYEGRQAFALFDRPLFEETPVRVEELEEKLSLGLISDEAYAKSGLKTVVTHLFNKVTF